MHRRMNPGRLHEYNKNGERVRGHKDTSEWQSSKPATLFPLCFLLWFCMAVSNKSIAGLQYSTLLFQTSLYTVLSLWIPHIWKSRSSKRWEIWPHACMLTFYDPICMLNFHFIWQPCTNAATHILFSNCTELDLQAHRLSWKMPAETLLFQIRFA